MTRLQSEDAYSDWMDVRKAEDVLNAEIAEHEQANRWHEFQRDDEDHRLATIRADKTGTGNRVNDPKTAARVVVMQRCHQQDLSGRLLEQGGWDHLCLPAEYEGSRAVTSIGFADVRQNHGELLWRERFGPTEIESLKRSLGSYAAAGQLQQRPSPLEGGLLKRAWFRFWQPHGANLPPVEVRLPDGTLQLTAAVEVTRLDELIQSWDCSFKNLDTSDYVVWSGNWNCLDSL
jgi:hypothetical protein